MPTDESSALTQTLTWTFQVACNLIILFWALFDTIAHVVQVETHLRRVTPVVARTGVGVTVQLVHVSDTIWYSVTDEVNGQTKLVWA